MTVGSAAVRAGPLVLMAMGGAKDNHVQRRHYNASRAGTVIMVQGQSVKALELGILL